MRAGNIVIGVIIVDKTGIDIRIFLTGSEDQLKQSVKLFLFFFGEPSPGGLQNRIFQIRGDDGIPGEGIIEVLNRLCDIAQMM